MIELNSFNLILIFFVLLILYAVFLHLKTPLERRQLSSKIPSLSNGFWNEIKFAWSLAMKRPKDFLPFYKEAFENNGPVVHFKFVGQDCVVLYDPDDLKILLSSLQYMNKGPEYDMLKPWLNEGLLVSSGSKWQLRRKLLTSTFHFKTLDMYTPSLNKHSQVLAKKLLEASTKNEEVSVIDFVTLCSLDMICETILGSQMNAQEGKSVQYVQSIKSVCKSVIDRIFQFWLWNDLIFRSTESGQNFYKSLKVLHDFTDNVIKNKRELLKNDENKKISTENSYEKNQKKSFLDLLISVMDKNADQMTDKDIREEVDTFLFEGHDTSSIAIIMTIILLGLHQNVQDTAREELTLIFGDSDRHATMEDLNAMKYVDVVIKEALRLYPSVPVITRQTCTALNIKNYSIPPDTTIIVVPYILHRNKDIYPDPEHFIPERFLDEENKSKFLFGYLPFSAGPRNCIGQKYAMNQMKTVISTILRNVKIETLGTMDDIEISAQLLIRIESLPKVKFYAL